MKACLLAFVVLIAALFAGCGGGEQPVLTGPAFVDKSNVDAVSEYAAKGTR